MASEFDDLFEAAGRPLLQEIHGHACTWYSVADGVAPVGAAVTLILVNSDGPDGYDALDALVPDSITPEHGDYFADENGRRWTVIGADEAVGGLYPVQATAPHVRS